MTVLTELSFRFCRFFYPLVVFVRFTFLLQIAQRITLFYLQQNSNMDPSFRQELQSLVASMIARSMIRMAPGMAPAVSPAVPSPVTPAVTPVVPVTPLFQRNFSGSSSQSSHSSTTPVLAQPSRPVKRTLDLTSPETEVSQNDGKKKKKFRKKQKNKSKKGGRSANKRPRKKKHLRSPKQKRTIKRRRHSDPQLALDKKVVNKAVMELLDSRFLAPLVSPLFPKVLLKNSSRHKKNREMNLTMYKNLTRDLLRYLTRINMQAEKQKNPTVTSDQVKARYRRAMFLLVKKRRANHVQSWRTENTHCPLIYTPSGLFTHARLHGFQQDESQQQQLNEDESQRQTDEGETTMAYSDDEDDFFGDEFADDFTSEESEFESPAVANPEVSSPPVANPEVSPVANRPPVTLHFAKAKCVGCGEMVEGNSAYPPDSDKGWSNNTSLRCEKCWDEHVQQTMLPSIANPSQREKKTRQVATNKRKRDNQKKTAEKKKKKRARKPCRCGSTEHQTVRHSKCPLNKKNNPVPSPVANPEVPSPPVANPEVPSPPVANPEVPSPPVANPEVPSPPVANPEVPSPVANPEVPSPVANPEVPSPVANPEVPSPDVPTFPLGSNVLAKWGRSWYLSHVCAVQGRGEHAVYDVYCPVTEKVKPKLDWKKVRPFDNKLVPSRADCVNSNAVFSCDGETWKVRSVSHGKNHFRCVRVFPEHAEGPNVDDFEIGFVMKQVRDEYEHRREQGPI